MEASSTYPKFSFLRVLCTYLVIPLLLFAPGLMGDVYGQGKQLATEVTHTSGDKPFLSGGGPTVVDAPNALEDDETFARVLASPGIALGGGAYDGVLELTFPEPLPENTWSYVRINGDGDLFGALLGGSLGDLLGDVLGAVLLGRQEIEIQARNGTDVLLTRNSSQGFDTDRVRLIVDNGGNYHLAIRPAAAYDRIRLTNRSISALGLGATYTLDVYNAFYFDESANCLQAQFTSFDGSGLDLSLLPDNTEIATNIGNAVDDDEDTYSQISVGGIGLGVGSSLYQTIYYDELSAPEDYLKIKLGIGNGATVNAQLIGNIEIRAFAGSEEVYAKRLSGGLINGVDVLGLLQNGEPATIYIGPGESFDRVEIGYNALVDLNLLGSAPIYLYDIKRYGAACPEPDAPAPVDDGHMFLDANKECADNVLSFENANFPYNAVDGHNGTYTTLEAGSGLILGIGDYTGHIELGFDGAKASGITTYIRIDFDNEILLGLLDGSIGDLVNGVGGALFGQHYFTVEVKNGDNPAFLTASSNDGFLNEPVRVVQDKHGHYYVAVTPDQEYDRIRITEYYPGAVGLAGIANMNVYHACVSTGSEDCAQAFATYSESSGISLDLLNLGDAGINNAHLAIDDDDPSVEGDETYSEIGIGTAGIGASTFQFVDFYTLSSPADYFKVKIGVESGSVLDVELLNNIEIRAYNGDELVYSQRLQNGLVAGLDILGLLSTDNVVTIPIGPGVAFDRVAVGVSTLVDLNALSTPVRLYSIKRFGADCPDPNPLPNNPDTESPFNGPDCGVNLGEFEHVNFAYNAIDGDIDTYATLSAGSGVVLGAGAYDGFIELGYDQPVPALETSYIRIDLADEGLLDALLGGSLGDLLADVGDLVLFGDHYFDISVRDASGAEIYNASSRDGFEDNTVRIVRDAFGRYYIAFTADQPYQSVRITLHNDAAAGLDAVTTMNVYSMCRETVFDPCEQATFTSFDGTGLSVNLLEGANPAGVINPQYVIDDNNSNYAELSLGTAAIGATIYQDIYFKTKVTTTATDKVRLRMQVPTALVNADILGAYRIYLYNGDDEVYDATLQSALINGLDLLGLLNSGGRVNVEFEPGADITYDRVRFEVGSVLGLGIGNPVRLYNVYRISDACPDPEFEQPPFEVCADVIIGDGANVDDIQNLTDGNHNSYATIRSDAGLVVGIGAYSGHVELGFSTVVPAGTSSYIRIGYEEEILNALLAGSLGGLVNDLLNGVALGDHYFNVIVKDENGNEVVTGSSRDLFDEANGQIRLVQDTKGRYYLEIRPTTAYQSVRLEDHTTALLGALSSEGHLDVYGMCHTPTTFECPAAFSTSYEGTGLNLDALNIGGAGVQNAFWAIDQNTSSASTLSLGTLGVGATIQQNIQFDRVLTAGDPIQVRMEVGGGTLNATILSSLEVVGYLDGVEVYAEDFTQAFVEANIVDLLNASDPADVTIEPDVAVDEIAFRLSGLLAVGVAPNLSIYHVIPFCESFAQSFLEVTKDGALADGVDFNEVTATIIDAGIGGPAANKDVEFTITHVDGTVTTETITTNANGEAILQITSTIAGVASVTATVEGMVITEGSPAEVTFIIPNNLSITKVADEPAGVTAGESTTFTVTITNDGPAPIAVGKVIPLNERPSDGLTITNYEVTSGNASVDGTGNSASVTVTTAVPVAGTITLTITADVAANAPATVANGIDVWGPDRDPDNDTPDDSDDTDPIPVDRDYGLDGNITKLAADGADAVAVAGEEFTYTVTVVNGGPSTILNGTILYLQDELSAGQTIISIEAGSANITVGTVADDGSFTVTANEDIEETEQFTLTVTADVASDIAADIVNNTINIWSEDPVGDYSTPEGTDTTPDYPVDRDYGFEDPEAVVKVATDGSTAVATAGEAFSYTVTLTNRGPSTINAGTVLYLQDLASAGQSITGITSDNGTVGAIGASGEFTLTVADAVAPNGTISLTVAVDVAADITADVVNNTINVWSEDPAGDYSTPEGTDTTPDYPVDRDYGFGEDGAVVKVATDGSTAVATAGEAFSYTATLTNMGPSTINAGTVLYLQDVVSAGQTITGITSDNGAVGAIGTDGEFTLTVADAVAPNETIVLTVAVDVAADITADVVNNTINVWSEDPAGDYSTPEGTDTTPDYPVDRDYGFEDPGAVVKVATDGATAVATAGEAFSYTATLTNMGPSTINAGTVLYLQDLASAGQSIAGITSDNGTVGAIGASGEFTLTVANAVAPNGTITLTVAVDVAADITADVVNNTINVWSEDPAGDYSTPEGTDTTPDYPVDRDYGFGEDGAVVKVATDGSTAVATAGEAFSYTATLTNRGPSTINAGTVLYLQDLASAGQTITGITSDNGTVGTIGASGEFTLTVANAVAPNGAITLTVAVDVAADITADVVNNTINVWSEDPAGDYSTPEGTDTTPDYPVDRDYDFGGDHVVKAAVDGASAIAIAGEEFAYTVTVTNGGPSTITAGTVLYLQDALSAGQSISSITAGSANVTVGTVDASGFFTVTANADIADGDTFSLTVTANVDADAPATINNTINIWSDDPAGDPSNPDGSDTTPDYPVDRESVLSIIKDANDDRVTAGESTSFTLTITNEGPSAIASDKVISLGERPSAGLTITGYEVTSGNSIATASADMTSAEVTTSAVIPVGGTITVSVTADVDADAPATITNGIDVWGPDKDPDNDTPDDGDDTPEIPVDRESNLSITKVADDARVIAGGSTSFTVTVTNDGPSAIASGEVISLGERPTAGLTITGYTVTSGNGTATGTGNSATVTTSAVVPVGGAITLTVTADVNADAPATVANGIDVWGPDKDPETDTPDDGDDTPEIPVDRESNLSITKVADDARVIAGGSTSFTVTVTNDGPSAIASGEVISLGERPTAGLTITGYTVTSGNGTAAGTGNSATVTTNAVIPVGGTITVSVTADVDANAPATVANGIDVWGPDKDPETDTPDDGDDTPEIPVDRESNLGITKVADQSRVKAGTNTTFTVTVTNNGPSVIETGETIQLGERPSTGVTITGYEVVSGAATIASTGNNATLTTTGAIAVDGTIVVRITAAVAADAPATITNGIDVWGPDKDPGTDDPDDEDDTPEIPVDPNYTLSITKEADQARVKAGTSTTFTVTITNNGPSSVASGSAIQVAERPGAGVTITGYEVTSGNATADGTGNEATVNTTAAIPAGGTITLKITADIAGDAEGTITNGIAVWSPDKDPGTDDPDDEDDTPEIPVDPNRALSITKVADQEAVIAGTSTTFTVTVTNNGPSRILSGEVISLGERPDAGITITGYEVTSGNATVSGTGNSATLTTTSAIAVDGTIVVKVTADVTAAVGQTISNGIAVWGPDKDPDTDEEDDETETPEIPVVAPYTLSIEKVGDQPIVEAGTATSFTVTITNNGPLEIEAGKDIALEERPGTGVTITGYEIVSGAATIVGNGNSATITTNGVVGVSSTIVVRITADVAETATGTITNGIAVWGPDKDPGSEDPDDEDDTNPIPIDATLEIPNLFTPNGDGLNDRFVIKNLMQYNDREVLILNRWGNQVYKSPNYNNDWDGNSLSEGTYYYIIRVRNGNGEWQTFKGAIALIRVTNR